MKFKLALPILFIFLLSSCERGDIEIFESKPMFSSNLQGKWVLVNYWADWCPPCIKEIPEIAAFAAENPDIKVFAFNFDRLEAEDLKPQIKRFGITYPSLISHPKNFWGITTPKTLPATYFISPQGELVFSSLKPLDKDDLTAIFGRLQNGG